MNLGQFFSFIAIKQHLTTTETTLSQTHHNYERTEKDPFAYYTVSRMIIEDSFTKADIIFSRSTMKDKMTWRLINADLYNKGWSASNDDKLLMQNAKMSDLVSYFVTDVS